MTQECQCYIGRKACGCIVMAVVDNPEHRKDVAKALADVVKDGLAIERVTGDYVREHFTECTHEERENKE